MANSGSIKKGEVRNPLGKRNREFCAAGCQRIVRDLLSTQAEDITTKFLKLINHEGLPPEVKIKVMWPIIEALGALKSSTWQNALSTTIDYGWSLREQDFTIIAQENLRLRAQLQKYTTPPN